MLYTYLIESKFRISQIWMAHVVSVINIRPEHDSLCDFLPISVFCWQSLPCPRLLLRHLIVAGSCVAVVSHHHVSNFRVLVHDGRFLLPAVRPVETLRCAEIDTGDLPHCSLLDQLNMVEMLPPLQ